MKTTHFSICALAVAWCVTTPGLQAATIRYNGDGDWSTDANWNTGSQPVAGDDAYIENNEDVTVTVAGEVARNVWLYRNASLTISAGGDLNATGSVRANQNGGVNPPGGGTTSTINVTGGSLTAGSLLTATVGGSATNNYGIFNISGGTVTVNGNINVGTPANNWGEFNIIGDSATIVTTGGGDLIVGGASSNGGTLSYTTTTTGVSSIGVADSITLDATTSHLVMNLGNYDYSNGYSFTLATYSGTLTGEFSSINIGYKSIDYSGGAIVLTVPEPSSTALLGLGGLGLLLRRKRG
jgi:hypothetical protein